MREKIVLVEWVDSCEPDPNTDTDEIPEPQTIYQAGFLVRERSEYITIAGAMKPELGTMDYLISIPRSAVKQIIRI